MEDLKYIQRIIKYARINKNKKEMIYPKCQNVLYYAVASNIPMSIGHVHAKCKTENCISFMM